MTETIDELWQRLDADRQPPVQAAVRKARARRQRNRRLRRRAAWALAGLLVALVAVTVVSAYQARTHVLTAREGLERGRSALLGGDVDEAAGAFRGADASFASARRWTANPASRLAGAVPWAGASVRTADALAQAGRLLAGAGAELVAVSVDLPDGPATLAPTDGVIPVGSLRQIAPALEAAHGRVAEATALVAASPARGLVPPVAAARAQVAADAGGLEAALAVAAPLAEALPAFLGADGPRRYFVAASNPAELRGTGGFLGAYGILTAHQGRLEFSEFQSVIDLTTVALDDVPPPSAEYAARWGPYGGAGFPQNINMTPDFPSAAQAILNLYEATKGARLDGVLTADPYALQAFLTVTGPTEVPDIGTVAAHDVVQVISTDAYGRIPDSHERKEVLGAVAAEVFNRFLADGGRTSPARAAQAMASAAGGGHIQLYAAAPDVQAAFAEVGVDGAVAAADGDYLALVVNNGAANKADFYLDRALAYEVWLEPDGSAWAVATTTLRNNSPTVGLPLDVIGPNLDGLAAGENRSLVSLYCGAGCELTDTLREDGPGVAVATEFGRTVLDSWEQLASGEDRTWSYVLRLPDAWDPATGRYELVVQGQTGNRPAPVEVTVHAPDGFAVTAAGRGVAGDGRTVVWAGQLRPADRLWLEVEPVRRGPVVGALAPLSAPRLHQF